MIYIALLLIALMCFAIIGLIVDYNNCKDSYQERIELLENVIVELSSTLEKQNHSVKISYELQEKLKIANRKISNSIVELNTEMLALLYEKL